MATKQEAQEALYTAVVAAAGAVGNLTAEKAAAVLTAAAVAYRAASGGPQVGGVHIDGQ